MLLGAHLRSRRIVEAIDTQKRFPLSSAGKSMVGHVWERIRDNKETSAKSYDYWRANGIPKKFGISS